MPIALSLDLLLCALGLPLQAAGAYLGLATWLSAERAAPTPTSTERRFRFIVPAHNESAGIADTVVSLLGVDYPKDKFDVLVVADNCSDDTAARARAAGALVLERTDAEKRGKGYALDYAFSELPSDVDAVVVIDADTLVSPNLLRAFAARREGGAHAVQADYRVRNPNAGWRTRLIAVAFGSFHVVRSRARERLGLSCGLRGNGMCFSAEVLRRVPHRAYSVVEDVEYGIRLGEAGERVHYADEAHVYGEMVTSSKAADSQRRRWEEGRRQLVRENARRLLSLGLSRRDPVLFDLGLDLIVPPLSRIAVGMLTAELAGLGLVLLGAPGASAVIYALGTASVSLYVLRGWQVSGTGLRGLVDLGLAPVYVGWKATLRFRKPKQATASWVRTRREAQSE